MLQSKTLFKTKETGNTKSRLMKNTKYEIYIYRNHCYSHLHIYIYISTYMHVYILFNPLETLQTKHLRKLYNTLVKCKPRVGKKGGTFNIIVNKTINYHK